jgi:thiamine biosynthesis lipoprotein
MGSALRLTAGRVTSTGADAGQRAWDTVVESFEVSEAAMSRFRETSELTALNRLAGSGVSGRPSDRLRRALVSSDRAHRITGGRFDPRVLADLDRLGYRGADVTTMGGERPSVATEPAGHRVVERTGRHGVSLARPVDLGGIGKGLALRWAAADLVGGGMTDFLLEAGGDLIARGLDPSSGPWLIGIEDPTEASDHLAVIAVVDGAVATSSVRVHRWSIDGRTVHHLLDPRTGEPADGGLQSVTVAGPDPAWAEVWSKVLFVGGRDRIADEARSRGMAAWWVADDGTLEMTADARARTMWVAAEDAAGHTAGRPDAS